MIMSPGRPLLLGAIVAAGTLLVEGHYSPAGTAQAITAGFAVFSLFSVGLGLNPRSETQSIFNQEILDDWRQLGSYGATLLFLFLAKPSWASCSASAIRRR